MDDREVCKICFAYFVRPWRRTNKCCSPECSLINRQWNERKRKRRAQGYKGTPRESWSIIRAAHACDLLLELLRIHHTAPVSSDTQKPEVASDPGTSDPQLSDDVRRTKAEPETGAVS